MVQPKINELSGVDHPAHLTEGWLMMKDASPETAELLARAELLSKGIDPDLVHDRHGSATMPITDEARAALPADIQEYIKSLESRPASTASDTEAEDFEKALAGLPEPVRKSIRDTQRRAADAEAMAKGLFEEAETRRFEAMAKELEHLPGVDANGDFAQVLRKSAASNPSAFDGIFKVLKAADAAVGESQIWGDERGSATIGEGSAAASIEGYAKDLMSKDAELTYAEAMTKAVDLHPELYTQHRKEV